MERPRIRKTFPTNSPPGSAKPFYLQDPFRLTDTPLELSERELELARMMTGEYTGSELREAYRKRFQEEILPEDIEAFTRRLDDHLILENEKFRRAYESAQEAFREEAVRPMGHMGEGYPEDPAEFRKALEAWLALPAGPGPATFPREAPRTPAVFAPHIDIPLAGHAYAHAYKPACEDPANELFVCLCTAHYRDVNPFILTGKDFETPFGTVETDRAFVADLHKAFGADLFEDELIQKVEHSVEFQAVFLDAMLRGRRPFRIVPVLVSSFAGMVEPHARPADNPLISDFLAALDETLAPRREKTCVVAGVDLAHVGRKFGDGFDPDAGTLKDLETADRKSLARACALDADGFWDDVMADGNARKICGLAPVYVALKVLKDARGEVKAYGSDFRPDENYVVTFAGVVFHPSF